MAAYRKVLPPFFMLSFHRPLLALCNLYMRIFNWLWRFITFIVLLGFAIKNNQPVTLRYFFDMEWQTTLVVVLLLFFTTGVAFGVLAMLFNLLQERKEITRLRREIRVKNQLADIESRQDLPIQPT